MNKKYIAEGLGAFLLTFSVLATMLTQASFLVLPTALVAGLSLMALVFMFARVSGGHFNPAVSIGLWSVGKLSKTDLPFYVLFQVAGAVLAKIAVSAFGSLNLPSAAGKDWMMFAAEVAGATVFCMGIASVVYFKDGLSSSTAPFIVGLSLLLGLAVSVHLGAIGVLNPAVSVALNILSWPYLLGSVVGSVIGFNIYKYLAD